MGTTRKLLTSGGVGLLAVLLGVAFGGTVGADGSSSSLSISFPLTTVVIGDPGTIHQITSSAVAADMVGQTCSVTADADNNGSVHPSSNLIVGSGASQVVVPDVEAAADGTTKAAGSLTLGSMVTVAVQLGSDGVFSGGGSVDLVCAEVSPATTSTTVTTTTTIQLAPSVEEVAVTQDAVVEAVAVSATPSFTG